MDWPCHLSAAIPVFPHCHRVLLGIEGRSQMRVPHTRPLCSRDRYGVCPDEQLLGFTWLRFIKEADKACRPSWSRSWRSKVRSQWTSEVVPTNPVVRDRSFSCRFSFKRRCESITPSPSERAPVWYRKCFCYLKNHQLRRCGCRR